MRNWVFLMTAVCAICLGCSNNTNRLAEIKGDLEKAKRKLEKANVEMPTLKIFEDLKPESSSVDGGQEDWLIAIYPKMYAGMPATEFAGLIAPYELLTWTKASSMAADGKPQLTLQCYGVAGTQPQLVVHQRDGKITSFSKSDSLPDNR